MISNHIERFWISVLDAKDVAVAWAGTFGRRLLIAIAAMFMWWVFGVLVNVAYWAFPVLLAVWVCCDSDWLRKRLTTYGQALDACADVVLLDGQGKETISSHVGRMYTAKYGNPEKGLPATDPNFALPWQAIVVYHITNIGEPRHVYNAVEQWAVDAKVDL